MDRLKIGDRKQKYTTFGYMPGMILFPQPKQVASSMEDYCLVNVDGKDVGTIAEQAIFGSWDC